MTDRPLSRTPPAARALLALAALAAVLFAPALFAGRVFYERDIHLWFWGQAETFVRCVAAGSWPVWDPYLAFGHPFWANPGAQVLYPPTWLNLLVRPARFYTFYVVGHFLFAGLGTYRLARRIGLGFTAALASAAFWTASGPFLSFASLWQHYAGIAWMPWVLLAGDRAWSDPSARRCLAWGAVAAGQALAGSVDACVMTAVLCAVWLPARSREGSGRDWGRRLGAAASAAAAAVAFSAALWLPALELLRGVRRLALTPAAAADWSLAPAGLGQLLLPLVPQRLPLGPALSRALFDGRGEPLLGSLYLGLCLLPLVFSAFSGRGRRDAWILAAIGAGALTVALGRHTPVWALLFELPPLRMLRYPTKATAVVSLAWALLAGIGLEAWLAGDRRRHGPTLIVGAVGALLAGGLAVTVLLFPHAVAEVVLAPGAEAWATLRPVAVSLILTALLAAAVAALAGNGARGAPAAVAALAVLDLALAQRGVNPTVPADALTRPPATLGALERTPTTRIFTFTYETRRGDRVFRRPPLTDAFDVAAGTAAERAEARAIGLQAYLYATIASRWGLGTGYEADLIGISPKELVELDLYLLDTEETPGFLRMLRLGAVDYVVAMHREGLEDLTLAGVFPGPFARPIQVYRVPEPLPRVFAVGTARVLGDAAAYGALLDPGFDPGREVILGEGTAVTSCCPRTRLAAYAPDRVEADVETDAPAYLVVVDAWAPGWRATVDGSEAPVLRANAAFRAVPVPAGRHRVQMLYRPRSVRAGLVVSGLAALVALAIARASARRGGG